MLFFFNNNNNYKIFKLPDINPDPNYFYYVMWHVSIEYTNMNKPFCVSCDKYQCTILYYETKNGPN